jgi:hypothetical protein
MAEALVKKVCKLLHWCCLGAVLCQGPEIMPIQCIPCDVSCDVRQWPLHTSLVAACRQEFIVECQTAALPGRKCGGSILSEKSPELEFTHAHYSSPKVHACMDSRGTTNRKFPEPAQAVICDRLLHRLAPATTIAATEGQPRPSNPQRVKGQATHRGSTLPKQPTVS